MEDEPDFHTEKDIVITVSQEPDQCKFSNLEAKKKSLFHSFLNGPYQQHQFFVGCIQELKQVNGVQDLKGRIFSVAPCSVQSSPVHSCSKGSVFALSLWVLNIILPFLFIIAGCIQYNDTFVCTCSVILSGLIAYHSLMIFIILHNSKIARRQWFVSKVEMKTYLDRENCVMEVNLESIGTLNFLSAGQKSELISRLARKPGKTAVLMLCTKSFWSSRVLQPLLCNLLLIVFCLIALIIDVDMIHKHHF